MIISSVISTKLDYALFHIRSWGQPFWDMTMACPKRVRLRLAGEWWPVFQLPSVLAVFPWQFQFLWFPSFLFFWIIFFLFYLFIYSHTTFYFLIYSTLFPFLFFYFMVKSILCQLPQKIPKNWLGCARYFWFFLSIIEIYI